MEIFIIEILKCQGPTRPRSNKVQTKASTKSQSVCHQDVTV